ncbi:Ger(x)C family spore germination protein [Paenibacillus humicola]|uniref:Ger(x)C family spore germination protein n=1 Tax=Paenibacillus humicola TaxID=3110540 RepID=UPI00237A7B76|nr:Ger(x)C family spore germination protein [Paenibacillus humicola]
MNRFGADKISRIFLILFLAVTLLPLAGCWDKRELNDVLLVTGAGIDKNDKGIELSIQMILPRALNGGQQLMKGDSGGGEGRGQTTTVISAVGTTIADAMSKLQEKTARRIFWGHVKIMVIGEELAREGISEYMDFLTRHPQPRLRMSIFVCKGKAADILDMQPELERETSEVARQEAELGFGMQVTLKELLLMLRGETGAALLPWLEKAPMRQDQANLNTALRLTGSAVFKQDKMIGHIDDEVTNGVQWLRNKIKLDTVTIRTEEAEGYVSLEMIHAHLTLTPRIENEKWNMTVSIETQEDIYENTTKLNMMNPTVVKKLQKVAEKDLKIFIESALDVGQKKLKADIFGFAKAFHRKYPKQWESAKDRWDKIFPEIEVTINPRVNILRPGLSTEPPAVPHKEVKNEMEAMNRESKEVEEK